MEEGEQIGPGLKYQGDLDDGKVSPFARVQTPEETAKAIMDHLNERHDIERTKMRKYMRKHALSNGVDFSDTASTEGALLKLCEALEKRMREVCADIRDIPEINKGKWRDFLDGVADQLDELLPNDEEV